MVSFNKEGKYKQKLRSRSKKKKQNNKESIQWANSTLDKADENIHKFEQK